MSVLTVGLHAEGEFRCKMADKKGLFVFRCLCASRTAVHRTDAFPPKKSKKRTKRRWDLAGWEMMGPFNVWAQVETGESGRYLPTKHQTKPIRALFGCFWLNSTCSKHSTGPLGPVPLVVLISV